MLRNRRTLIVCGSVFAVTLATGCLSPVSEERGIDAGKGGSSGAGGGGDGGGACGPTGPEDGGGPAVSAPFFPGPQSSTEVNDFDLTSVGGCVAVTWVSDGALWVTVQG